MEIKLKPTNILVVLPTARDHEALDSLEITRNEYRFHWMDDSTFRYPDPCPNFRLSDYIQRCSTYISQNKIEAVLYSHDLASLVAAALCEKHHLIGPTVESMFLSSHKYYSRQKEENPIWFDFIDLDKPVKDEITILSYPVYLKPPCLVLTLFQYKIKNHEDLKSALAIVRKEIYEWNRIYYDFFCSHVNLTKYPLANRNIMLIEELVEGASQHCVEGWVDNDGTFNLWAVSDSNYYPDGRLAIDNYSTPSRLSKFRQEQIINEAFTVVKNHGIRNGFWNVELWLKGDRCIITEVNGRSASVWQSFYLAAYGKSLYQAMVHLACNQSDACHSLSPDHPLKPNFKARFCGQFHVITYGEGQADEFLDYEFIASFPELKITTFVPANTIIRQNRTSGFWLARFEMDGESYELVCEKANKLRDRLLKKAHLSPSLCETASSHASNNELREDPRKTLQNTTLGI